MNGYSQQLGTMTLAQNTPYATFATGVLADTPSTQTLILPEIGNSNDYGYPCFCAGTLIATPEGEVAVETLKAGDLVLTADGRALPVRWIGMSRVAKLFADPLYSYPIRIKAGALGENLPARDLRVSPDHAVFMDGVLLNAGALVNGTSILRETEVEDMFEYYHIELASHELILAEGAPAESFVDNVDRASFHNWDDRTAPAEGIAELAYPRAKSHRQVPHAIRAALAARAAQMQGVEVEAA
jgi:hypothetical protein